MNEENRKILEMLQQGKISVAEAENLLSALSGKKPNDDTATSTVKNPKYLRVVVDSPRDGKVNVRVPFQLLRAGVKMAALIPRGVQNEVNKALSSSGLDFDVGNLKVSDLEDFVNQLSDMTVDVENNDGKVKVFCE